MVEHSSIIVGKSIITASLTVTNLGVVLDRNLTMSYQVSKIVRMCTYKLRMVNIIRDNLSVHVAERVVNAMVTGNLDYCNCLLQASQLDSWEDSKRYRTQQQDSFGGETVVVVPE